MSMRQIVGAVAILFFVLLNADGRADEFPNQSTKTWVSNTSVTLFVPSNDSAFLQPIGTSERGRLHLEARYNYEDRGTASVFAGITGRAGRTFSLEATPLLGIVFGNTRGVAPGLELAFRWHRWELTSESEYLFDADDENSSFFYNWSELSFSLKGGLRVGFVGQRTQTYKTEHDLERGPLLGFERGNLFFTAYIFNVGFGSVYPAFTAGVSF